MIRRVVLCCLSLTCALNLCAEDAISKKNKDSKTGVFSGGYCGAGAILGVQKTTADINNEFRDRSHSVSSFFYGGTVTLGYHHKVRNNCFVGIEGGLDFGSASKTKIGGILKADSNFAQVEFTKRDILRQMFQETANSFETGLGAAGVGTYNNVVSANVWSDFVNVLRFIGGADVDIRNNFSIAPADGNALFSSATAHPPYDANPNANLRNIIGNTCTNITALGNGDTFSGLQQIRDFVNRRYPTCAAALRNFAEADLRDLPGVVPGTSAGGGVALTDALLLMLNDFFRGAMLTTSAFEDLGINPASMGSATFDDLEADVGRIYNPTATDNNALAFPGGVDLATIQNNVETKASFNVCPHLAFKFGCYLQELGGMLYAKVGIIQLSGHVTPVNNLYGLQDEKFRKITPFAAVGLMKNINEKWGYVIELSHAFKVTKNMKDVEIFGIRVKNKTSISRTNVKFMVTYRF